MYVCFILNCTARLLSNQTLHRTGIVKAGSRQIMLSYFVCNRKEKKSTSCPWQGGWFFMWQYLLWSFKTNITNVQKSTGGSRLMRISLLRFFKKIHEFALWVVLTQIFGYFISLVPFWGLFLANVNFFQNQKSYQERTLCKDFFFRVC